MILLENMKTLFQLTNVLFRNFLIPGVGRSDFSSLFFSLIFVVSRIPAASEPKKLVQKDPALHGHCP